jgi:SAM-dependent methyltransferase
VGHLEDLRRQEIEALKPWFSSGARVLEIGGGSGYQASVIASWSCEVTSVDLAGRPVPEKEYFPVQDYDGRYIPIPAAGADVVFSSNVLEHVPHLPEILAEIRRVLKPGGLAIHTVPSATWRLWTSLSHYAFLVKVALGRRSSSASDHGTCAERSAITVVREHGWWWTLGRALFPGPHGEYPNAASELYFFSRRRWRRILASNGFEVLRAGGGGLFYTGYATFPDMGFATRRALAKVLGSSTHFIVTRAL